MLRGNGVDERQRRRKQRQEVEPVEGEAALLVHAKRQPQGHGRRHLERLDAAVVEHRAQRRGTVDHGQVRVVVEVEPGGGQVRDAGVQVRQREGHRAPPLEKLLVQRSDDALAFGGRGAGARAGRVDLVGDFAGYPAQGEEVEGYGHGCWVERGFGDDFVGEDVLFFCVGKGLCAC